MIGKIDKAKKSYTCSGCAYKSIKWLGCCPDCNEWNLCVEVVPVAGAVRTQGTLNGGLPSMTSLQSIKQVTETRILTNIEEWDRVMGGGIVPSSFIVLTGDPGIGKSTLLLQISHNLSRDYRVYYFSTEESLQQILQRARRLKCVQEKLPDKDTNNDNSARDNSKSNIDNDSKNGVGDRLLCSDQSNLETIVAIAQQDKPDIVIIDSIQNCYSSDSHSIPGSVNQVRESVFQLMRLAKEHNITLVVSGHITKEGVLAGPKVLEHMVDAVFYLQSEDRFQTRVLSAVKNRFGPIDEVGFFHMYENGLVQEPNINKHLLSGHTHAPGSVLVSVIEGTRPLLLELQALTIESKFGIPQRVVSGVDHKQVVLIAAILQKYLFIKLNMHDIFFKISGGIKVKGNSTDMGIALALLSSYFQQPIPEKSIVLGEISLTGAIKPIKHSAILVKEAHKFGIINLIVAKDQSIEKIPDIKIYRFSSVYELVSLFSA